VKVYIVMSEPYNVLTDDEYTIEKVFDKEYKANAYVKEKNKEYKNKHRRFFHDEYELE